MEKLLNIIIGIILVAILVGGGFLGWTYLNPPNDFVGSKLEKELRDWQAMADVTPDDPLARANLGAIYMDMGDTDKAIEELETAVELAPEGYTYRYKLGEAYRKAGRPNDAIEAYKLAMEGYPKGEKFLPAYQIAEVYKEQGDLTSAKDFVQQAIADDAVVWNAHYLFGQILEAEGDRTGAKGEYEEAAKFNPGSTELQQAIQRVS